MTETTTPTDEVVETPTGSESTDLPVENTNDSAVETNDDTTSEDDSDTGSIDSTTDNGEDEPAQVDSSLKKFAKSQGFDPENLSPDAVRALTLMQKQVRKDREELQKKSQGAVEKTLKSVDPDAELTDREFVKFEMQKRDMIDSVREYWVDNPEDRQYEAQATAILQAEKEQYGDEAMIRLAANMPRLIREAKYAAGAFDTTAVSEKARREERERLRKEQEGSADGMNATTTDKASSTDDVREFLKNYDPSDPEQRKKADELIAKVSRGEIY